MAADRVIVRGTGLRKIYGLGTPLEVEVLKGIDLEVRSGEFVAVVGQSGSGKSTLLNLLGALDTPSGGSLTIENQEIFGLNSDALADLRSRSIGFVFQFHYLLDEFTCLENALMPILVKRGRASTEEQARVRALLERVGLSDQLHKLPGKISGGQQQRVAIVRALAHQPSLVLADEPTGNLDSRSGQQVFELMREITRAQQVAFVMVTHDDRLARAADRILRIEDGMIGTISQSELV
ncbi:ABC transporter ATP-binding protein [bacterium]|nr:ABC transporter ATP-binding protein [bacterium]